MYNINFLGSSFPNAKSLSSTTPTGRPNFGKNSTTKMLDSACSSQQTKTGLVYRHQTSTGSSDLPSVDKQTTSDVKNPSIVKVAPFSHQPSPNCAKSSVGTSSSSITPNNSTIETNAQVKPENQMVLHLQSKITGATEESTEGETCLAPDGGLMTVFAPTADGQMRPICRTICSCQLRKRAEKYIDKGKTKDDSIVIDSDEEDDKKNDVAVDTINKQGIAWLDNTHFPSFFGYNFEINVSLNNQVVLLFRYSVHL